MTSTIEKEYSIHKELYNSQSHQEIYEVAQISMRKDSRSIIRLLKESNEASNSI